MKYSRFQCKLKNKLDFLNASVLVIISYASLEKVLVAAVLEIL